LCAGFLHFINVGLEHDDLGVRVSAIEGCRQRIILRLEDVDRAHQIDGVALALDLPKRVMRGRRGARRLGGYGQDEEQREANGESELIAEIGNHCRDISELDCAREVSL
jgi:hypothetical protein